MYAKLCFVILSCWPADISVGMNKVSITDNLWIEKYKPKSLEKYIGLARAKLMSYTDKQNSLRNILIHSNFHGVGKSLLAKLISKWFFVKGKKQHFNALDYNDEDALLQKLKLIAASMMWGSKEKTVIVLDNFDIISNNTQKKIAVMAEMYSNTNLFVFVADNITPINSKIKNDCMKIDIAQPLAVEIQVYIEYILNSEDIEITGFDLYKFIKDKYPNIKSIILDLQEMLWSGSIPENINYQHSSDIYLEIYNALVKEKNWEIVEKLLKKHNNSINRRHLNKFIWSKAIETNNVRLIQITESNEVKIANNGDEEIIFDSSLIELVK